MVRVSKFNTDQTWFSFFQIFQVLLMPQGGPAICISGEIRVETFEGWKKLKKLKMLEGRARGIILWHQNG